MNLLSSLGHLFVLLCLTRITICFYSNSPCRAQAISKDALVSCLSPNVDLSVSSIIPVSSTRSGSTSASHLIQAAKVIFSATIATGTVLNIGNRASDASVVSGSADRTYIDSKNGFSIEIPEGFSSMPRKAGSDSLSTGQPVEILLVAQDFLKGASLSVGRSDVPQLLDDFSVPWAGKPINSIVDVGTANIVSELLILQRQGAFGSIFFKTKLGVTAANDAELTNMDNNISEIVSASTSVPTNSVMFEFKTPLSAGIRYTIANSFLSGKYLYTVWLSVLGPLYETGYKDQLVAARNSFKLIK